MDQAGVQPGLVGVLGGQRRLDLLVLHDAARGGVGQEDTAGLQAALPDHGGRVDVEHPDLAGQHDQAVAGHPVPPGRRPLRSSTAPMTEPSVNAISAGPSQGSIIPAWNW